jgi:hypothetical protein
LSALVLLFVGLVENASADPVNSPRVDHGTIVCGDVTYTLVSPFGAPVSQALTANGSNSTSVTILIVDKAGTHFPHSRLMRCTAYPPRRAAVPGVLLDYACQVSGEARGEQAQALVKQEGGYRRGSAALYFTSSLYY